MEQGVQHCKKSSFCLEHAKLLREYVKVNEFQENVSELLVKEESKFQSRIYGVVLLIHIKCSFTQKFEVHALTH